MQVVNPNDAFRHAVYNSYAKLPKTAKVTRRIAAALLITGNKLEVENPLINFSWMRGRPVGEQESIVMAALRCFPKTGN